MIDPVYTKSLQLTVEELTDTCLVRGSVGVRDSWRNAEFGEIFREIDRLGYRRIFVCGAGTHTELIWPLLRQFFSKISGVIDRDPRVDNFRGVPLLSRQDYVPMEGDAVILSSASFEDEMFVELRSLYGDGLPLFKLYSDDSWVRFCKERSNPKGYWEDEYGSLLRATKSPELGGLLNASGFGFVLAYDYTFLADRLYPTVEVSEVRRLDLLRDFENSFESQLLGVCEAVNEGSVLLLETYALGDHVIQPVLEVVNRVLDFGIFDQVVVLISDQRTREFFSDQLMDDRWVFIDWVLSPFVGYFLPELHDSIVGELDRQKSRLTERLQALFDDSRVELYRSLRVAVSLYSKWISRLCDEIQPKAFFNVLDNRPVSAAFYLSSAWERVPAIQVQHGFQTTALSPYWANSYLGWKDEHSVGQYNLAVEGARSYFPVGNFFLSHLRRKITGQSLDCVRKRHEGRLFVFVFQGPPYWHVTWDRILFALQIIKDALPLLETGWRVLIKLRGEKGREMLNSFFSDLDESTRDRIRFEVVAGMGWETYWGADAVGVISSSAREEAAYVGAPLFSLESEESPACLSFPHYGMSQRINSAERLVHALEALPRRSDGLELDHSMEGDDRVLRLVFESLFEGRLYGGL